MAVGGQGMDAGAGHVDGEGAQALYGAAAAAAGRALLGAAGVDVEAIERAVGGRPRLDPDTRRGARSPRINVAIPETMDDVLKALAKARGVRTSVLVREGDAREGGLRRGGACERGRRRWSGLRRAPQGRPLWRHQQLPVGHFGQTPEDPGFPFGSRKSLL